MSEFRITGGARVGFANASYPFAELIVSKDKIELNASIIGKFIFLPGDILLIDSSSGIIRNGIKIVHKVPQYNSKIIFWPTEDTANLIKRIQASGFFENQATAPSQFTEELRAQQLNSGFPLKKSFSVAMIVLWNLFLGTGIVLFAMTGKMEYFKLAALPAVGLVLATVALMFFVPSFSRIALKEGRNVADIKKPLLFIVIILAILLLQFGFVFG